MTLETRALKQIEQLRAEHLERLETVTGERERAALQMVYMQSVGPILKLLENCTRRQSVRATR